MESWLARRPVLVWADCDVTRGHVQRSKGGLWFSNYDEFKEGVDWLDDHNKAAARMGTNGRRYVTNNFSWEHVFNRFSHALSSWKLEQ
jgi:glycosyltransferase involved in cell wall biosynthesis